MGPWGDMCEVEGMMGSSESAILGVSMALIGSPGGRLGSWGLVRGP